MSLKSTFRPVLWSTSGCLKNDIKMADRYLVIQLGDRT